MSQDNPTLHILPLSSIGERIDITSEGPIIKIESSALGELFQGSVEELKNILLGRKALNKSQLLPKE